MYSLRRFKGTATTGMSVLDLRSGHSAECSLIRWVHYFRKERKHHLKELIKLIDLKKISPHCISFLFNEYEKLIDRLEDTEKTDDTSCELFLPLNVINNARCEATITFVKDNFSSLKED